VSPASARFKTGDVVAERYEILEVIGHGTSGTVYRARDLYADLEREIVALKAIHPHLHSDRQIFGRFQREAAILRKLEGAHLCKLLDVVEEDDLLMLAIEYVDGPSLDQYLDERGSLPLSEVLSILVQVCAALETAHDQGVIHRDLKPSNVLIEKVVDEQAEERGPLSFSRELRARVVDFGLAKMVRGETVGTALTEQDMILGTPDYMSPEQVCGEELDERCDIYACGVMLYEMLVGSVPFDTPGPLTTMTAHINHPVPSPREHAPDRGIPSSLDRVVMRALAKKPGQRYDSARELAQVLKTTGQNEPIEGDTLDEGITALDARPAVEGLARAEDSLSTTMQSHQDEAIEASRARGGKVKIIVRDAPEGVDSVGSSSTESQRRRGGPTHPSDERRYWAFAALLAAVAAIAVGVLLGVR